MVWARGIVGVVVLLIGLLWIGQGLGVVRGSFMSGQLLYAILGVVVALVGAWLLWGVVQARGRARI